MHEPIFIVGCPRSGTTLLRSILNAHPNIAIPRETRFFPIRKQDYKTRKRDLTSELDFNDFWESYSKNRRFIYLDIEAEKVLGKIKSSGKTSYKAVLDTIMETFLQKMDKPRWGEKTPGHEFYLKEIFSFYPNAKVLFMVRDPRAVAASIRNVSWGNKKRPEPGQEDDYYGIRWKKSIVALNRFKENPNIFRISYEELVSDTEEFMKSICTFIGEDFDENMLMNRTLTSDSKTDNTWTTTYEQSVARKIDN